MIRMCKRLTFVGIVCAGLVMTGLAEDFKIRSFDGSGRLTFNEIAYAVDSTKHNLWVSFLWQPYYR